MIRRATGLLVGALLVLTLGGCGGAGGPSDETTGATREGTDVRERLAVGLAAVGSDAEMVRDKRTTLTLVEADWLPGWQVFDIELSTEYRLSRFYTALSDDDTVLVLSGDPDDSFAQMVRSAQVVVDNPSLAVDVANLYLDVTRDFVKYSYRIDSVSDIQWQNLDATEQQEVADFEAEYGAMVQPPVAEPSDTGWSVIAWTIHDRWLVRHHMEIAADGAVRDTSEEVTTSLLLPQSL